MSHTNNWSSMRDSIRARPAMYIGDVYVRGLHTLFTLVVGRSVDLAALGRVSRIEVELHGDGSISVTDDGLVTDFGFITRFETLSMTSGHWTGGAVLASALSARLEITSQGNGVRRSQSFKAGLPISPVATIASSGPQHTVVRFWPDRSLFDARTRWDADRLNTIIDTHATLLPELDITLRTPTAEHSWEPFDIWRGMQEVVEFSNFDLLVSQSALLYDIAHRCFISTQLCSSHSGHQTSFKAGETT